MGLALLNQTTDFRAFILTFASVLNIQHSVGFVVLTPEVHTPRELPHGTAAERLLKLAVSYLDSQPLLQRENGITC
jgi:hypothetical protein